MCIAGFYQDPEKAITDQDICKECDCQIEGTVDEGMCDERTSEEAGTVAGQCHCKTYVSGARCDHCTPGMFIKYRFEISFNCNFISRILEFSRSQSRWMSTVYM